jgi:cytochrome c peroxidase
VNRLLRPSSRTLLLSLALFALGLAAREGVAQGAEEADPPEVAVGERLFLETRFAQFFASHMTGVNAPLAVGDPVMEKTLTRGAPLDGPFAGQSMNCRACHLVDEQLGVPGGGMRTYGDFARRSPIPARDDGRLSTPRNSPPLVNASLARPGGVILHFDGEFPSLEALVKGTLSGRNYGWLPAEADLAIAHVARVIREDDGSGALAMAFGGAYAVVLSGTDPGVPQQLRLPPAYRIDVSHASDSEIFDAVARLIAVYVRQLVFEQDARGRFVGSPFDRFLERNDLPRAPRRGEAAQAYTARLREAVARVQSPVFVSEGPFEFHDADRVFGPEELAGLRIFLALPPAPGLRTAATTGVGNCAACHPAPAFTDFGFHNTGVTQMGYDGVHGDGAFARIAIPSLVQRSRRPDDYLPATVRHPHAKEPFRAVPAADRPGATDLGVWNIFANPDFPAPQEKLWHALCLQELGRDGAADRGAPALLRVLRHCRAEALLESSVAAFKTPGLRDLGHSAPYMHDGGFDTLEDVIAFYRRVSSLERVGALRNGAEELAGIALTDSDARALAAFLRSLDEDYD